MPEIESLLTRLVEGRVDFVVIGGYAAMAHGVSLLTQDLDVCMDFAFENLRRLQKTLADLHPVHRMTPQRLALQIEREDLGLKNLYLDTDLGQLDCLSEVSGLGGFADVMKLSEAIELAGRTCSILGIEGLIKAKQAIGRAHDQLTILQLKAIQQRQRDQ
jgi:hypothetical protein